MPARSSASMTRGASSRGMPVSPGGFDATVSSWINRSSARPSSSRPAHGSVSLIVVTLAVSSPPKMRCVYLDLDGTLLGPGASLLRGGDERFALEGVRALQACWRAGAEVALYSGRRQTSVFETARLIGAEAYAFEVGCGLVVDGELEWLTDGVVPSESDGSIYEQIDRSGAPALLLEHFAGGLEYETPW